MALPRELTSAQHRSLVEDFVRQELGDRHAYQWAIHCPKAALEGGDQPHAHIMYSERILDEIERPADRFFMRYNAKSPERGGCKKASGGKTKDENVAELVATRARWAEIQNAHLAQHQHAARVDHRTLKEQGIGRLPEKHLGPEAIKARSPIVAMVIAARAAAAKAIDKLFNRRSIEFTERRKAREEKVAAGYAARVIAKAMAQPAPVVERSVQRQEGIKALAEFLYSRDKVRAHLKSFLEKNLQNEKERLGKAVKAEKEVRESISLLDVPGLLAKRAIKENFEKLKKSLFADGQKAVDEQHSAKQKIAEFETRLKNIDVRTEAQLLDKIPDIVKRAKPLLNDEQAVKEARLLNEEAVKPTKPVSIARPTMDNTPAKNARQEPSR